VKGTLNDLWPSAFVVLVLLMVLLQRERALLLYREQLEGAVQAASRSSSSRDEPSQEPTRARLERRAALWAGAARSPPGDGLHR